MLNIVRRARVNIRGYIYPYYIYSDGRVYSIRRKRFIGPNYEKLNKNVYVRVVFTDKNHRATYSIHRLVAESFIPNPEHKTQVNHIDGIKYHNYWQNLEWVDAKENANHAYRLGLRRGLLGEKNPGSAYTEKDATKVCELLSLNKYTNVYIAKKTKTTPHFVANVKNGVCWKHIRNKYPNIVTHKAA